MVFYLHNSIRILSAELWSVCSCSAGFGWFHCSLLFSMVTWRHFLYFVGLFVRCDKLTGADRYLKPSDLVQKCSPIINFSLSGPQVRILVFWGGVFHNPFKRKNIALAFSFLNICQPEMKRTKTHQWFNSLDGFFLCFFLKSILKQEAAEDWLHTAWACLSPDTVRNCFSPSVNTC